MWLPVSSYYTIGRFKFGLFYRIAYLVKPKKRLSLCVLGSNINPTETTTPPSDRQFQLNGTLRVFSSTRLSFYVYPTIIMIITTKCTRTKLKLKDSHFICHTNTHLMGRKKFETHYHNLPAMVTADEAQNSDFHPFVYLNTSDF